MDATTIYGITGKRVGPVKRSEFLASVFGAPVTAKVLEAEPERGGNGKAFIAFEVDGMLSEYTVERLREQIQPHADKCNFEFAILPGYMKAKRVV